MSYTTSDFEESLQRVGIAAPDVARVVKAWGHGSGMGEDAGHFKWSEDGVSDWSGGFLMLLKDGSYAYLSGWCDYTGWGCQDGAHVTYFVDEPSLDEMKATHDYSKDVPAADDWDIGPADLNRWLSTAVTVNP